MNALPGVLAKPQVAQRDVQLYASLPLQFGAHCSTGFLRWQCCGCCVLTLTEALWGRRHCRRKQPGRRDLQLQAGGWTCRHMAVRPR